MNEFKQKGEPMKSIEVEINGKMTPVCFVDDVDKVTSEMRERHEKVLKRLGILLEGSTRDQRKGTPFGNLRTGGKEPESA